MSSDYPQIKKKQDEIYWFVELLNIEVGDYDLDITAISGSDIELHLLMYFARKTKVSVNRRLFEQELLHRLMQSEVNSEEIIQLQKRVEQVVKSVVTLKNSSDFLNGTDWIPIEQWDHRSGVITRTEYSERVSVEVEGFEFKGSHNIVPGKTFLKWAPNSGHEAKIVVRREPYSFVEYFFERFLNVIDGLPCSSFKMCPECQRYFLQATKKDKIYCNNKCASKVISRKRRKAKKKNDPEGHKKDLKSSSERARDSYVKKVQMKSGENVKIERRPWKYKGEE